MGLGLGLGLGWGWGWWGWGLGGAGERTMRLGSGILGMGTPLSMDIFIGIACGLYCGRSLESSVS